MLRNIWRRTNSASKRQPVIFEKFCACIRLCRQFETHLRLKKENFTKADYSYRYFRVVFKMSNRDSSSGQKSLKLFHFHVDHSKLSWATPILLYSSFITQIFLFSFFVRSQSFAHCAIRKLCLLYTSPSPRDRG